MSNNHPKFEFKQTSRDPKRRKGLEALARNLPDFRPRREDTLIGDPTQVPAELLLTEREFELLLEHANARYHAMPQPGLGDVSDPPSHIHAKAEVERLHRHIMKSLSYFGRPGDDA
ncbi:hypothetical protein [Sphingobium vermicomposti]|uniref:Uncharacterized protein n=1 Tax=Sphingobium vermicomposti TaxID=529005 RepID=A0A846M6C4_9SPHN|nr:hypothetical protein [Sphingobium vermicomposti]NIJ16270.1 hypothetical protein [Sphingobium vermicomposti]